MLGNVEPLAHSPLDQEPGVLHFQELPTDSRFGLGVKLRNNFEIRKRGSGGLLHRPEFRLVKCIVSNGGNRSFVLGTHQGTQGSANCVVSVQMVLHRCHAELPPAESESLVRLWDTQSVHTFKRISINSLAHLFFSRQFPL